MKGALVVLAVLLGVVSAMNVRPLHSQSEYQFAFTNWMLEHGRTYTNEEFLNRFEIFKSNMDYVTKWNSQNSTTVLGLNIFADLTNTEYQNVYLGTRFDGTEALKAAAQAPLDASLHAPLADTIDWRTKGAVTPIKDQGQCGSCWAFSTTGSVEGAYFLANGKLVSSSEQNLVDCSTSYGNQGCNGGLMNNAFKYIIANKGIDTEASYPYTAKNGACHFTAANVGATIASYKSVTAGSETALVSAINIAPVSVAIDASKNSFQLYKSGVYYESKCSSSSLDHGVLAVGYGTDASGNDYYIVKNSWGTSWGTQGYIQMSRNKSNNCGIATQASYPTA